ncbi:hypothetical protein ACFYUV_46545 [Nonomuraea sp. NPDC003560]|uniref:hypothetical protein n=1 Tax=Nonomuraea sp. NPDC003560 TaxID=3364341 RepID=UPI0036851616
MSVEGRRLLAAASTGEKRERARRAGADDVIGYDGLKEAARAWAVDVAVDPVGGELSEQALRGLRHAMEHRAVLEGLPAMPGIVPAAPEVRPPAEAGRAMDDLLERRVTGKIVLVPSS